MNQESRTIQLTKGKVAIVDEADFEWLSQWNWCARLDSKGRNWYATRFGGRTITGSTINIQMHRFILGLPPGRSPIVDHRDRDGLNNVRSNLRICTTSQNSSNNSRKLPKSGYRGVHFMTNGNWGKWAAQIRVRRQLIHLGTFDTPEEAAHKFDEASRLLRGDFALTNETLRANLEN